MNDKNCNILSCLICLTNLFLFDHRFVFLVNVTYSGCSVVRLARHAGGVEVGGSNPLTPTNQNPFKQSLKGFLVF